MNTATLTTVELNYNERVYVQRVIYTYMQNNDLTQLQTFTYDQLIDRMQDGTIWMDFNERAVVSQLVARDLKRTDLTATQRENVKHVLNILGKGGN